MTAPSRPAASGDVVTTVTINGVPYAAADRATARWNAVDELIKHLGGSYDELSFTVEGVGPTPPLALGLPVTLSQTVAGGSPVTEFSGGLVKHSIGQVGMGWSLTFQAIGLGYFADLITITDESGGGSAVYNRSPTEGPLYVATDAGLSVGDIVSRILTIPANATALDGYGVGAYTSLTPPTLPAATVTDLASLTVVPTSRVSIGGEGLLNQLEELVRAWHPQFALWIQPDGTIRCRSIFTLPAVPLVVPGEATGQNPDPVDWPHSTVDVQGCYGAVQILGKDVRGVLLSVLDGTLAEGWSGGDEAAWTSADVMGQGDAQDAGAVSSLTANSCDITSDDPTRNWPVNYWNASVREGWIGLFNFAATGITIFSWKKITSTAALSAGGTAAITWDAGDPVDSLSYDRYVIVGRAGSIADVGRLYTVREPSTGALGTATYIGSHLEPMFPLPVPFSNGTTAFNTSVPVGWTLHSPSGSPPYQSFPATFEVIPSTGQFRFTQPTAWPWSTSATLAAGYPSTAADGKPQDVQIYAAVNRGSLGVRSPSAGYSGTAQATYGAFLQRVKTLHLDDDFTYQGQASQLQLLADELLAVVQDTKIQGTVSYKGFPTWDAGVGAAWDPLAMGYALNLSIPGVSSPWDGLDLPVVCVALRWPQGAGMQHQITFTFSNERRPFGAVSLYEHAIPGTQGGGMAGGQMPLGSTQEQMFARASGLSANMNDPNWQQRAEMGVGVQRVAAMQQQAAQEAASRGPEFDESSFGQRPGVERGPVERGPAFERGERISAREAMPFEQVPRRDRDAEGAERRGQDTSALAAQQGMLTGAMPPPPPVQPRPPSPPAISALAAQQGMLTGAPAPQPQPQQAQPPPPIPGTTPASTEAAAKRLGGENADLHRGEPRDPTDPAARGPAANEARKLAEEASARPAPARPIASNRVGFEPPPDEVTP